MNITDNAFVPTMDAQVTEHFADTDTIADADGVERRNSKGAHAKTREQAPEWITAEFEWRSWTDQATGEVKWALRPRKAAVERAIKLAPAIALDGIDAMEDEDHALARQLCQDIKSLIETAIALDTYQEDALKRHFVNQLARKAIYCARSAERAESWSARVQCSDQPEPQGLTDMVEGIFNDSVAVATLRSALLELDPTLEINYKGAAWDIFKYLAYSNTGKYLNPDELANRETNAHEATGTLLSRLRARGGVKAA